MKSTSHKNQGVWPLDTCVFGVTLNGMRRFFIFWWLCIREAFPGNAQAANDWQWVVANPWWQSIGTTVGVSLGALITPYWSGAPMMSPESSIGALLGGAFGFVVTWLIAFGFRFLNAPSRLFHREKERADALAEKLGSKSLEIVFQHNVHFIRQNMELVAGGGPISAEDEYLLALHNKSNDKEIRGVSLCVTESNKSMCMNR